MASNTGWMSVGELEIDAQDLGSSRSAAPAPRCGLVEQPHVLDGDHRLVGEGLEQRDLLVGEARFSARTARCTPIGPVAASAARRSDGRSRGRCASVRRRIGDPSSANMSSTCTMRRSSAASPSGRRRAADADRRRSSRIGFGRGRVCAARRSIVAVAEPEHGRTAVAQLHRRAHDGIEHRLHVGRRAADDAQDLARWRSAAPAPPCVSLNRRTFSIAITAWSAKVCSRSTSLVVKAPACARYDRDRADDLTLAQDRHGQRRPKARRRATS